MSVVVIGRFSVEQTEALRLALARAGATPRMTSDGPSARRVLKEPHAPPASLVIVDAAMTELEPLMTWLRSDAALMGTIVVAVVPAASDRAFADAHALGCDDVVVQGDLGAVTRRAAALASYDPTQRPVASQGCAIVAHPNEHRRRLLGRTLRLAGFEVCFAERTGELTGSCASEATLLVAAESLAGGALECVSAARRVTGKPSLPSIVLAGSDELAAIEARMDGNDCVAAVDEQAPPDHLLFVANELLRPGVRDVRASPRVLNDALCAFRPAGQLGPVLGLTYNLSREGLYVRTLDPPPTGTTLWFELRPPGSRDVVHLRGTVVWVRSIERGPGGAAPPGFGVRIVTDACPPADLHRYQRAYEQLVETPRMVA